MLGLPVVVIVAPCFCFCSRAHCSMAPSICRRLLMQAFFCAEVRALTKFGIAIAASRPMIATTIMISTRVKPYFRWVLTCIVSLLFALLTRGREPNKRLLLLLQWRSRIAFCSPRFHLSTGGAKGFTRLFALEEHSQAGLSATGFCP